MRRLLLATLPVGIAVAVALATAAPGVRAERPSATSHAVSRTCAGVRATNVARHDVDPVSHGRLTAVVIGDSYAEGQHLADPRTQAWSTLLGEREHWTTYVLAVGGSGFTNPGPCGDDESYAARVGAALAHRPAVVVVQGGLNDTGASPARERAAATALLAELRSVPRVVVIGPAAAPARRAAAAVVDGVLRSVTAAAGRTYVSTYEWRLPYLTDRLHLTAAGHADFAAGIAAGLAQAS